MNLRLPAIFAASFAALVASPGAFASTAWDESVDGDLSNNGLAPTVVSVSMGENDILGTTGNPGTGTDRDYFSITIGAGQALTAINLLSNTAVGGDVSFMGVQAGPQVTVPPNTPTANGLLGWTHYGDFNIGQNLLPAMAIPANGSTGFTPPLGAGTYSFWVQDFNSGTVPYGFDFEVAAVPEPASGLLLVAGLGVLAAWRRRRAG